MTSKLSNRESEEKQISGLTEGEESSAASSHSFDMAELLESIQDGFFALDKDWRFIYVNRIAANNFGLEPKDLINRDIWQLNILDSTHKRNYRRAMLEKKTQRFSIKGPLTDRYYDISVYPSCRGISVYWHDVTERKEVEEALKESEDRFNTFLDNSPNTVWMKDEEGHYVYVNKTYEVRLGKKLRDMRGKVDTEVWPNDIAEQFWNNDLKVLKRGRAIEVPEESPSPDGSVVHWITLKFPFRDSSGKRYVGGIAVDITERKRMEEQLQVYAKHLEDLVKERTNQLKNSERMAAIGQAAGMIGHDLRNPLQAIDGAIYLLEGDVASLSDDDCKKSMLESLGVIAEQARYMNKIVSDLQDFVRPMKPQPEEVNIRKFIKGVLSAIVIPENVKVETLFEDIFGITIDSSLMIRVFNNLILNAVQAMPNGGKLTIKASSRNSYVTLSVSDTGVGIPDDVKPKLFTPLFTTKSKGQGFGLAVCKRVVEAHGGEITFESAVGKGTTFTIKLPA